MKQIIASVLLIFSSHSFAITGNELSDMYENKGALGDAEAIMYVGGFIDSSSLYKMLEEGMSSHRNREAFTPLYVCVPKGANYGQASDIVKKFLDENPARRHEPALQLVYESLIQVWRCTK
jgi:hypothetical protein